MTGPGDPAGSLADCVAIQPPTERESKRAAFRTAALVLFLFVVLTAVIAWPVLKDLDGVLVGRDDDVPINPWADWWTLQALTRDDVSFWRTNYLFYPQGTSLAFHSFSHLTSLISLALRPVVGVLPAYNLAILLNFVLAGLAMFQLARYLTGSKGAAILAGLVFAFNSLSQYQTAHPVLDTGWTLAWVTLFFIRAWRERSAWLAVVAAFFVFLTAATSTLILTITLFWLPVLAAWLALSAWWAARKNGPAPAGGRLGRLAPWRVLGLFALLSLLFSLPLVWPLLQEFLLSRNTSFVMSARQLSISMDMLVPITPHWYKWEARGLYVGIAPAILALAAVARIRPTLFWFLVLAGSYVAAIGPTPTYAGQPLGVTLPWNNVFIPLLRSPYRMNILLSLALAVLVAYGWLAFRRRLASRPGRLTAAAALAGLLIFGEYAAPSLIPASRSTFPLRVIPVSDFYTTYLPQAGDDSAIAPLPTARHIDKHYLYYQTFHGRPIIGGLISRPSEEVYAFIRANPLLRAGQGDEPNPPAADVDVEAALVALTEADIGYLVLDKKAMGEKLDAWREVIPRQPIYEDQFLVAYLTSP